jgi:hypothetical protein
MIVRRETEADLSIEARNSRWFAELYDLTPRVEALFAQHGTRFKPPSMDACQTFANALMALRGRIDAAPLRQASIREGRLRPDITPSLEGARKSAGALHRHLEPLRRRLADSFYEIEAMGLDAERVNEKLALLDSAVEAIEMLLPVLDQPPLTPSPENSPIEFIARKAREAWADVNDGKAPQSKDPAGPLVNLVADALSLIDIDVGTEMVSADLRGRRQAKIRTKS